MLIADLANLPNRHVFFENCQNFPPGTKVDGRTMGGFGWRDALVQESFDRWNGTRALNAFRCRTPVTVVSVENEKTQTISVAFGRPAFPAERPEEAEPTPGSTTVLARASRFLKEVPVDQLRQSLKNLTARVGTVLAGIKAVGGFELSEVQIGVELTAEGGVNLIGNLTAGAKGAM